MLNFGKLSLNEELCWKLCLAFCVAAFIMIIPDFVMAADETTITNVLCRIVVILTGKVGKAIATIAVVFLGVGLFLGKLSWGVAVATAIGVAGIFGAGQIVAWLSGDTASTDCPTS